MSKRRISIQTNVDSIGVTACRCGRNCGDVIVEMFDAQDNVIAAARVGKTEAVELAGSLMDCTELFDEPACRPPGTTLQ
jgi:hypothetical protein